MTVPHEDALNPTELRDLELLVDGELGGEAERRLVRRLEQAPDGWRRCALAFLASQALSKELASLPREDLKVSESAPSDSAAPVQATLVRAAASQSPRTSRSPRFLSTFAVAASFLVAFGLGLALRGGLPIGEPESMQLAAPTSNATSPDALAQADRQPNPAETADSPPDAATAVAQPDEWPTIRLVETSNAERVWADDRESIIPPHIRRALERMGHRIEEHRQMLPIELDDGTQGYIPAERVELHYVGNQYQ